MFLHDFIRSAYSLSCIPAGKPMRVFSIDDQDEYDVCPSFCHITAYFAERNSSDFTLAFRNIPWNSDVEELVKQYDGQWSDIPTGRCLRMTLTLKTASVIEELAVAIQRVVRRGQQYLDCNWKWIAPRVSDSLLLFAEHLQAWEKAESEKSRSRRNK